MSKIRIVTVPWSGDHAAKDGEETQAMLHGRVFVGDVELPCNGATVRFKNGSWAAVEVELTGDIEIFSVPEDRFRADDPFDESHG